MAKKDLASMILEFNIPLLSAEDMPNRAEQNDILEPPSYDAVHETEAKQPVDSANLNDSDSTDKKDIHILSDSEYSDSADSDSDTEVKTRYSIKDKNYLLKQIEKLQEEQETLRRQQKIHEQHIKDLLKHEPCVHKQFKTLRKSYSTEKYPQMFSELNDISFLLSSTRKKNATHMDEHIYVQLEQLYANLHVLHFPSKTVQNILTGRQTIYSDVDSTSEIMSLRSKVKKLEGEILTMSNNRSLPLQSQEESKSGRNKSPATSNRLRVIPGRPTSPIPMPPPPKDVIPVEVTFKWTITNYSEKLRLEKADEGHNTISSAFYLTHCGYRAQVEVYLNGNGTGLNRCMSVFLRIVKGEYDQHLKWPVNLHLVVILVNQSDNNSDSLKAVGNQFQYSKPFGSSDGESDCWGLIEFASHEMTKQRQYINGDRIVLKCRVQIL